MSTPGREKILKAAGSHPSELELTIASELFNLEMSASDLKAELHDLVITSAKELEVDSGRKAVVVFVPYRQLKDYHKIQIRLVRELEKKFSGKHIVFVAQRTILAPSAARSKKHQGPRPRSRTLTAVQEAILEDIVYPTEIVGKRVRHKVDGSKLLKVYLDPKDVKDVEMKLDTFAKVYNSLTNKDVVFEFPVENP